MSKFVKKTQMERRRIRWSSTEKTTKTFVYTILTVLFFTAITVLFSWSFSLLIGAVS